LEAELENVLRSSAEAGAGQEGRLAAGLNEDQRRDAAQAVKLLPSGWTLTQCVQFVSDQVSDHVKRTTQVLTVKEAIDHFLVTKEKTSHFHSNDLARRLKN